MELADDERRESAGGSGETVKSRVGVAESAVVKLA